MPPKQPISSDCRTTKCVLPRPVIRREEDQSELKRDSASVVEDSLPDTPHKVGTLASDDLAALHAFFKLLSRWEESLKGEIEHE